MQLRVSKSLTKFFCTGSYLVHNRSKTQGWTTAMQAIWISSGWTCACVVLLARSPWKMSPTVASVCQHSRAAPQIRSRHRRRRRRQCHCLRRSWYDEEGSQEIASQTVTPIDVYSGDDGDRDIAGLRGLAKPVQSLVGCAIRHWGLSLSFFQ